MESTKQIKIEIRNRWTGSVVFEYTKEGNTITETVLDAIRRGADLHSANLRNADLRGSNLYGADLRVPTCAVPTYAMPRDVIYHVRPRVVSSVGKKPLGIS